MSAAVPPRSSRGPEQIGEGRAPDDVAQRRLCGPAHGLRVVLHFERGLLRVVHHPEEHGVDVDRHGVGRQRLLRGEAGRDHTLIDPRVTVSTKGTIQKRPGPRRPMKRPSRRTTARSHCRATRGAATSTGAPASSTAATAPIALSAAIRRRDRGKTRMSSETTLSRTSRATFERLEGRGLRQPRSCSLVTASICCSARRRRNRAACFRKGRQSDDRVRGARTSSCAVAPGGPTTNVPTPLRVSTRPSVRGSDRPRHRVRVDAHVDRKLADGRELRRAAGDRSRWRRDFPLDLGVERGGVPGVHAEPRQLVMKD